MLDDPSSWAALAAYKRADMERYLQRAALERLALDTLPRPGLPAQDTLPRPGLLAALTRRLGRGPTPAPTVRRPCPSGC